MALSTAQPALADRVTEGLREIAKQAKLETEMMEGQERERDKALKGFQSPPRGRGVVGEWTG